MEPFSPGFRLSWLDIGFVALATLATSVLAAISGSWAFVVGFVCGNFFLCCNVFRVARPLELA